MLSEFQKQNKSRQILKAQQELLGLAERENRDLTPEEAKSYSQLETEYHAIQAGELSEFRPEPDDNGEPEYLQHGNTRWTGRQLKSGQAVNRDEVRILKPNESLRSALGIEDREQLSLGKLIKGAVTGDWHGAEPERRTALESADSLGGFLIPSPLAVEVIDLARAKAVCFQAGAKTVPMATENLSIARVAGDFTGHWRRENQAIPKSDMSFEKVTFHAKTLACLGLMSLELFEDTVNLDSVVKNSLAQVIALGLDRACLRGDGSGAEPKGLENWNNINSIAVGGALSGFSDVLDGMQDVEEANGEANALIGSPARWYYWHKLKDGQGNPVKVPDKFARLKQLTTTQVEDSKLYLGDYSQMLVGMRTQLRIDFSQQAADTSDSAFSKMQVWVRCFLRADIIGAHEDHFCVLTGIV